MAPSASNIISDILVALSENSHGSGWHKAPDVLSTKTGGVMKCSVGLGDGWPAMAWHLQVSQVAWIDWDHDQLAIYDDIPWGSKYVS